MATQKLSVSLDPYSYECLQEVALEKDRSLSYIVCVAIQQYVEGNEYPGSGLDYQVLDAIKERHGIKKEKVGR